MSSASDPHSILNRNPELGRFQTPAPKPKITRYFAGKAPEWEKEDSDDDIFPHQASDLKSLGGTSITSEKLNQRLAMIEDKSFKAQKIEERRVVRGEAAKEKKSENPGKKEKPKEIQAEVINNSSVQTTELKMDDSRVEVIGSSEIMDRRAAIKARLLAKEEGSNEGIVGVNKENSEMVEKSSNEPAKRNIELEKKEMEIEEEEVAEEEEEEEDIIEEYEEGEGGLINIMKPIYVRKEERSGVNDKQVLEELALEEEKKKLAERKRIETKILVSEAVKRVHDEDEDAEKSNSEQGLPEDNDDIDQEQELESWKIRELKRIKKEREERGKREKELVEIARRRNLTDEERKLEDMKLGSDDTEKPEKSHYRFLQKYYHKGAFFLDSEESILKRDYNIAVGEDLFDKSGLPSVLKKRRGNFGKKGQSKYTHLTDQDTTDFDPAWKPDESLREKMYSRMAGLKGAGIMERKDLKKLKL